MNVESTHPFVLNLEQGELHHQGHQACHDAQRRDILVEPLHPLNQNQLCRDHIAKLIVDFRLKSLSTTTFAFATRK